MNILHESLRAWFAKEDEEDAKIHTGRRLYYGSDLAPSACERAAWFRVRGAPRAALSLATQLMFRAGHRVEGMVMEAFRSAGRLVETQIQVRPVRPSAWAWSGRADGIAQAEEGRVGVEVKTARSHAFKVKDPNRIIKESHVWQASVYAHELRRTHGIVRMELVYLDRDGSNQPIVVPLTEENGKLIPEAEIVKEEARKANLVLTDTPKPPLRDEMTNDAYPCSYCTYRGTACDPDGERAARKAWPAGAPASAKTPASPDPALSSAKAITDAAEAAGAPKADEFRASQETLDKIEALAEKNRAEREARAQKKPRAPRKAIPPVVVEQGDGGGGVRKAPPDPVAASGPPFEVKAPDKAADAPRSPLAGQEGVSW